MQGRYQTLVTLFQIVKDEPLPLEYPFKPRHLLLRLLVDWSIIQTHLTELESEGLIYTKQQDTLVMYLTRAGLEKASLIMQEGMSISGES